MADYWRGPSIPDRKLRILQDLLADLVTLRNQETDFFEEMGLDEVLARLEKEELAILVPRRNQNG